MRSRPKHFGLNARSFAYAVVIHVFVGVLLFASFNWERVVVATPKAPTPEPVQAVVVSEADVQKQLEALKQKEEQKKQEELKAKKRLDDMVRDAEAAEEKRKREQQKLAEIEKRREEQAKAAREAEKRKQEELRLAKLKEEEKKKKAEQAARKKQAEEAARKKREDEERRKELAEKKRKERELAERKRREQEAAEKRKREQELAEKRRREAELQARLEEERVQRLVSDALSRYTPIIQQKVSRNWSRPPGAQVGLSAEVRVRLTSAGEVISAQVVRSSGNPIFDRSVENAVLKASPLPIPQDQTLNSRFRQIQFKFNPDQNLISKL